MKFTIFAIISFSIITLVFLFYFLEKIQMVVLDFFISLYKNKKDITPSIQPSAAPGTFFPQGFHGPSGPPQIKGPSAPPPNY